MASSQEEIDNSSYQSDDHILCDDCDKLYKGHCPEHGPLEWIKSTRTVSADHFSPSVASLPDGLVIKESGIPDNDMGVFAARLIYKRTMFGPFEGVQIPSSEIRDGKDLTYSWDILQNGISNFVLDGTDEKKSNWIRYVTYARDKREQNLIAFQYQGEIFYRTFRDVYPGEELMVWYEDEYSCSLDELPQEFPQDQVPEFACQRCRLVFAGTTYIYKHHKFRCPGGPLACTYGARTTGLVGALFRLPVAIANDTWSSPVPSNNDYKPRSDESHHSRRKRKPRKLPRPSDNEEAWNPEQPFGPPPIAELNHNETDSNQNRTTMVMLPPEAKAFDAHPDFIINNEEAIEPEDYAYENYLRRLNTKDSITDYQEKRPRLDGETCVDEEDSKYPYRCNECGKSFARPVWWAKHESRCRKKYAKIKDNANHSTGTSIVVESLSSTIDQISNTKQVKPRKEPYKCGYCDKKFACPSWMRRHEKVHTKNLKTKSIATAHRKPGNEDPPHPYECVDCGRTFAVAAWLTRHRATIHPNSKAQTTKPRLQPRGHVCRDCGRGFAVAAWLTRHRMTAHKNNVSKKHFCGICGRSFAVAFWLTRHLKIHEGSEQKNADTLGVKSKPINPVVSIKSKKPMTLPWVCGQCGLSFRFESWLKRHQKNNKHTNGFYQIPKAEDIDQLLVCEREGCGKSFKTRRLLGRHRRRHLKKDKANDVTESSRQLSAPTAPPFICQYPNCGKSYSTKRMLTRHMQNHVKSEESMVVDVDAVVDSSECQFCKKVFSTKDLLNRHIKRMHGKALSALGGGESKAVLADMETKSVAKSGSKSAHTCKFCHKVFSYPLLLQRHLKRHRKNEQTRKNLTKALNIPQDAASPGVEKQSYVCEICNVSFKSLHILNKHMEKHLGEKRSSQEKASTKTAKPDPEHPYQCDQCERKFAASFWLTRHKNEHKKEEEAAAIKHSNPVDPKLPFQCEECGRGFAVAFWLTRHKREHVSLSSSEKEVEDFEPVPVTKGKSKVYVCDTCGKEFIWPSWLVKHRRVHKRKITEIKTERPFKEKRIKKKKAVEKQTPVNYDGVKASKCFEMFEENGVKQYRCTICGKATVWHTGIVYHIRVHHTKEKPFKCRVCGKDFHMAGDLTKHARRHSGEKPFYCQHCKKRFTTSQQASKHAAIHSSELPFHCKHCGKRYRDRSSVWRHIAKKSCPGAQGLASTTPKVHSKEQHSPKTPIVEKKNATSKKQQIEEPKPRNQPRAQKKPLAQLAKSVQSGKKNVTNKKKTKKVSHDCKNCNKTFGQLDEFKAHIESYAKAGQIVCEYCGKCWARTADLTRHLRVHTGERPYLCPDCGLGFKVSDALKRHMLKLHPKSTKTMIRIKTEPSKTEVVDHNMLHGNATDNKKTKQISENDYQNHPSSGGRKRAQEKKTVNAVIKNTDGNLQNNSGKPSSERTSLNDSGRKRRARPKHADNLLGTSFPEYIKSHVKSNSLKECKTNENTKEGAEPKQSEDLVESSGKQLQINECETFPSNDGAALDNREHDKSSQMNESLIDISVEYPEGDSKQLLSETFNTSKNVERDQEDNSEDGSSHPLEEHREGVSEERPPGASVGKAFEKKNRKDIHSYQKQVNTDNQINVAKKEKSEEPKDRPPVTKNKRSGKSSCSNKGRRCEFCGKVFSAAGNLARHVRLHTGEKPFQCKECGESFMRTDILSQHMVKYHT